MEPQWWNPASTNVFKLVDRTGATNEPPLYWDGELAFQNESTNYTDVMGRTHRIAAPEGTVWRTYQKNVPNYSYGSDTNANFDLVMATLPTGETVGQAASRDCNPSSHLAAVTASWNTSLGGRELLTTSTWVAANL